MPNDANVVLKKIKSNMELAFNAQGIKAEVTFINAKQFSVLTETFKQHEAAKEIMLKANQTFESETHDFKDNLHVAYYDF